MKKFKFPLDGLLKLREFKESQIKTELGKIVTDIEEKKQKIVQAEKDIVNYLDEQDRLIRESGVASDIQQLLSYIKGLEAKKVQVKEELAEAYRSFDKKKMELALAMGDVKLISGLKEKKHTEHKKEQDKRIQQDIEELFNMRKKAKT